MIGLFQALELIHPLDLTKPTRQNGMSDTQLEEIHFYKNIISLIQCLQTIHQNLTWQSYYFVYIRKTLQNTQFHILNYKFGNTTQIKSTLSSISRITIQENKNIRNILLDMRNKPTTAMFLRLQIFMLLIKEKLNIFLTKPKTPFVYRTDHYLMASMSSILELAHMI